MRKNHAMPMPSPAPRQAGAAAAAGPAPGRKHQVVRRGLPLAVAAAVLATGAASASAATPVHIKQSVGPVAFDVPAGALCDFAYHEEDVGTLNTTRFFDDQGNLIGVEDQIAVSILHRNAATGQTLTEDLHYAAHVDVSGGQVRVTGQSWHLGAGDGRLVLAGAGLIATDLLTGDILRQTPGALASVAATICPALGGSPAS
jgi:hypothetical protein